MYLTRSSLYKAWSLVKYSHQRVHTYGLRRCQRTSNFSWLHESNTLQQATEYVCTWVECVLKAPESGIELLHACGVRSCPYMRTYGSIFRPLVWRAVVSMWVQVKRGLICDAGTHFSLYPTQQNTSYWEDAHLRTLHSYTLLHIFSSKTGQGTWFMCGKVSHTRGVAN